MRSFDSSLERLGVDYIDVLLCTTSDALPTGSSILSACAKRSTRRFLRWPN